MMKIRILAAMLLALPTLAAAATVQGSYGVSTTGYVSATTFYGGTFIGDGSGLTNLPTGSGDSITSSTTKVTANSTGTISLTTGGVTTGYLDTAGRLVLPGVSTTATGISSTNGYFSGNVGIGTAASNAKLEVAGTVSATGVVVKGVYVAKGMFTKADPDSVAFIKSGAGTATVKAGTVVEVNNVLVNFANATTIAMPGLTAGTDYAIYACEDGTAVADSNLTSTASCTGGYRKIGGFHYAPGGNATNQSGGDSTPAINAYSFWDLHWRPACKSPSGMTLVADSFWADIYLTNTDPDTNGTSKYGVTIADGNSPPKIPSAFGGNGSTTYSNFNWYEASEVMQSWGKDLMSQQEFMTATYGTTEQSSIGTDAGSTGLASAYTSKWGLMQSTGVMWVWGRDASYRHDSDTWAWATTAGSRGQLFIQGGYGTVRAVLGGKWNNDANAGSRASVWNNYPWNSNGDIGARGRCDHLKLE